MHATDTTKLRWPRHQWLPVLTWSLRTAVAAVVSLLVAQLFRLPEAYWAPITTLVITQSSLGAALKVSTERLVGTILGGVVGAIVASRFTANPWVFGGGVFLLGFLTAGCGFDRAAYRFGGVTLAVVFLIARANPAWEVALHRSAEVTIGIGVALILAVVWPEKELAARTKS